MSELELKIEKLIKDQILITESEAQDLATLICELPEIKGGRVGAEVSDDMAGIKQAFYVMVKLADILQILDDEEYAVSVHSNDTIDDKISESIANTAIIDFKKQLKQELLSKFSE